MNERAECWNCHKRTRIENYSCQYCGVDLVVLDVRVKDSYLDKTVDKKLSKEILKEYLN